MAKLTLPHPNKDFVPLSPLTAQELDEMVANNKAVADFANGLASGKILMIVLLNQLNSNNLTFRLFNLVI